MLSTPLLALPSWVPAAGAQASYVSDGAVLTNGFNSTVPAYYSTFYAGHLLTDYSSGVANPHMGTHGGVVFRGGGHAGTNYNATCGLRTNGESIQFVQLNAPTDWTGNQALNDNGTAANDASHLDQGWGDSLLAIDSQKRPASPHSYAVGDIMPPTDGGGTYGTFLEVLTPAPGQGGNTSVTSAPGSHELPLASDSSVTGNTWGRSGASAVSSVGWGGSVASCYVSSQKRVYYGARSAGNLMRWLDVVAGTHNVGTGTNVFNGFGTSDPDNGVMLSIPDRAVMVGITRNGAAMEIKYAAVDNDPTALVATTSGDSLFAGPSGDGWQQAFYCTTTGKIILYNLKSTSGGSYDTTGFYEVTIPTTLTDAWPVARTALSSGTFQTGNVWQRPCWMPALKCSLQLSHNYSTGVSTLYAFRPPGT